MSKIYSIEKINNRYVVFRHEGRRKLRMGSYDCSEKAEARIEESRRILSSY